MRARTFSTGFHRTIHFFCPVPFGSSERTVRYNVFIAEFSFGKCPFELTARRNREFNDSIAFVEDSTPRTSRSISKKGTNSVHVAIHLVGAA